jgi:hypothetical protein
MAVTRKTFETICCICQRQKGNNGWERAAAKPCTDLSHGYCPECYREIMIQYGLASALDRLLELHESEALV